MQSVEMALQKEKRYEAIKEELELPRVGLVKHSIYQYCSERETGFCNAVGRPRKNRLPGVEYMTQLEMENALLKKYHTELCKLTLARRDIG